MSSHKVWVLVDLETCDDETVEGVMDEFARDFAIAHYGEVLAWKESKGE